jgi:hypothetical protein
VLAATATEWVVDGVHRNTTDARPLRPACLHLVVFLPGFDDRFLGPATTSDDANRGATLWVKPLDFATWQLHDCVLAVVRDEQCAHTGGASELATVARLALYVAHRNPLRDFGERERVAGLDFGGDAHLHCVAHTDAFCDEDETLVTVFEFDGGDRRAPCWVVLDVDDRAGDDVCVFDLTVGELCFVSVRWCPERGRTATATLAKNSASHG